MSLFTHRCSVMMSIPIDGKIEAAAGTYRDLTESGMTVIIGGEELEFKTPKALGIKVGDVHDGTLFMAD